MAVANSEPHPGWPADWLVPEWPAPAGVRAVFSSRTGGYSLKPFDSLNLGTHVGDVPAHVARNRQALQQAVACAPIFLDQVHGQTVVELTQASAQGQAADASFTRQYGLACTVMVADCLPVLLAHLDWPVVAAAHAGWRGLAGGQVAVQAGGPGILACTFERFASAVSEASPAPLEPSAVAGRTIAWLGPCIGPQAFEVGAEVKAAFESVQPHAAACFAPHPSASGKFLADLPALGRLHLAALGIKQVYGNDGSAGWCTVSQPSRFFSHRRSGAGGTGRMAACIWLA